MDNKNTIQKAIDYLGIYATKSEKFADFKFIGKSIDNPLQVSYISQKKIDSLLEYTETKILGTKEQRQKHFTSTTIFKLLQNMFINEADRTTTIASDIDKQLRKDFCKDADLFTEDDVKGFYSQENTNYIYNANGSCMNKKPISYFEIYDNFINTKAQVVGLKVGKSVVARAILWTKTLIHKKEVDQYDKDNNKTTFQVETHREKQYFLDRIYISKEFQNSNQEELQNKLYNKIKRALKLRRLDCYSLTHIKRIHTTDKLNYFNSARYPNFSIQIKQETFQELENYPYMDTFRWGKETTNNICFDNDEDNTDYILEDTSGNYTEGGSCFCECCDTNIHEDDSIYSEIEEETLCEDCAVYIEERQEYCRTDNATYNNYSGNYHYQNDLDY